MRSAASTRPAPALVEREWDTAHFGFVVAQIPAPELESSELEEALVAARLRRIQLVYWAAHPCVHVPAKLLHEFSGALVDRKVTYERFLDGWRKEPQHTSDYVVASYPQGRAEAQLVELAIAASAHSRFRVDSRVPEERCRSLYERWMQRSAQHEIADEVLVAWPPGATDMAGMITLSLACGTGSIGLIAVAPEHRGRGIGGHLLEAAHTWMHRQSAGRATVVTQQANVAACRLYERAGYHLAELQHYYHFWVSRS
jgi:dTDP-4-amino-4,6-dideoxy-D-galactose acyltransferase